MKTGEIIKKLLEERGIKQVKLAEFLDVSANTVNRWIPTENKEGIEPSEYNIIRIAEFFDVPVSYIKGDADYWDNSAVVEHLFESTNREKAWTQLLNYMGYSISDKSDYSSIDLSEESPNYQPFEKLSCIKYKGKEKIVHTNALELLLKKMEKHIEIEIDSI